MNRALYIADILITAKRKRDIRYIRKNKQPVILNEDGTIPPDDLTRQLRMMVKDRIELKKFNEYTYTYKIDSYKFSSKLYETKLFKGNTENLPKLLQEE